jgi:putative inorganic carbon (HCO3(-)) transporter
MQRPDGPRSSPHLLSPRLRRRRVALVATMGILAGVGGSQLLLGLPPGLLLLALAGAATVAAVLAEPRWGFYALAATFSTEYLLGLTDVLTATKLLGGLVAVAWGVDALVRRRYTLPRAPVLFGGPLLLVSAAVSMLAVESVRSGLAKLGTIVQLNLLVLLTAMLLASVSHVRVLALVLMLSTAISAGVGLILVMEGSQEDLAGLTRNRNAMGTFIAMCIPFIFFFYPRVRAGVKVALLCMAALFFVAEALSYSREGFLLLLAALAMSWLLAAQRQHLRLALLLATATLLVGAFLPSTFWQRVESIQPAIETGAETVGLRYQLWHVAIRMIRDHPILGVGPGNYMTNFMRYGGIIGLRRAPLVSHNTYLSVTAELGFVGGALFVLLCLAALGTYARAAALAARRGARDVRDLAVCFGIATTIMLLDGTVGDVEYKKYLWLFFAVSAVLRHLAGPSGSLAPSPEPAAPARAAGWLTAPAGVSRSRG